MPQQPPPPTQAAPAQPQGGNHAQQRGGAQDSPRGGAGARGRRQQSPRPADAPVTRVCAGGGRAGQKQQKQQQQPLTTKIVDELLAENGLLLQAVDEATVTGRLDEAAGYAEKLQEQLLMLVKLADAQVLHCGPAPREVDV